MRLIASLAVHGADLIRMFEKNHRENSVKKEPLACFLAGEHA